MLSDLDLWTNPIQLRGWIRTEGSTLSRMGRMKLEGSERGSYREGKRVSTKKRPSLSFRTKVTLINAVRWTSVCRTFVPRDGYTETIRC